MDKARVQQRLREQKLAKTKLEQKKNSGRARAQKSDVAEEFQDKGTNDTSQAIEIVADVNFVKPDPPPPNGKQRNNVPKASPKVHKQVLDSVSSSSIASGGSVSTSVTLNEVDETRLLVMNFVSFCKEVMEFSSQVLYFIFLL